MAIRREARRGKAMVEARQGVSRRDEAKRGGEMIMLDRDEAEAW
jgi:hypothetical protein